VKSYGYVPNNEQQIKTYLYNYGPLYARYAVYENFYQYNSGIYSSASGRYLGSHAVLLVGYGVENGVKYWIVKNSWDSWWGEKGFFRMLRGSNFLGIEGGVSAVTSL
jgi:cathepsin B